MRPINNNIYTEYFYTFDRSMGSWDSTIADAELFEVLLGTPFDWLFDWLF